MKNRKFNDPDRGLGVIIALWVAFILVDLALLGVAVWAVIKLVNWVVTLG